MEEYCFFFKMYSVTAMDLVAKHLSRQANSSPLNFYWSLASPWSSTLCCYTYNSKEIEDRSNYVKFLEENILQNALK